MRKDIVKKGVVFLLALCLLFLTVQSCHRRHVPHKKCPPGKHWVPGHRVPGGKWVPGHCVPN